MRFIIFESNRKEVGTDNFSINLCAYYFGLVMSIQPEVKYIILQLDFLAAGKDLLRMQIRYLNV